MKGSAYIKAAVAPGGLTGGAQADGAPYNARYWARQLPSSAAGMSGRQAWEAIQAAACTCCVNYICVGLLLVPPLLRSVKQCKTAAALSTGRQCGWRVLQVLACGWSG